MIPKTQFYLAKVVEGAGTGPPPIITGPNPERGDITGFTDECGFLTLVNVQPGKYFLIVWAPYNWSIAQVSEDDPTPLLLELSPNERKSLPRIYLSWP
jgi:hypothetical protein